MSVSSVCLSPRSLSSQAHMAGGPRPCGPALCHPPRRGCFTASSAPLFGSLQTPSAHPFTPPCLACLPSLRGHSAPCNPLPILEVHRKRCRIQGACNCTTSHHCTVLTVPGFAAFKWPAGVALCRPALRSSGPAMLGVALVCSRACRNIALCDISHRSSSVWRRPHSSMTPAGQRRRRQLPPMHQPFHLGKGGHLPPPRGPP